jgi:hypothetical protein
MVRMAQWAVIIPADRWATERLFHHDTLTVAGSPSAKPLAGDEVLLVAGGEPPRAVALGIVKDVRPGAESDAGDRGAQTAGRPAPDSDAALPGVQAGDGGALLVAYTRRVFDEPVPVDELKLDVDEPVAAVEPGVFRAFAGRLGADRDRRTWLVSVALPIEAINPAEAVRQFWSHVLELGPAELPTYVWPSGDELAMQAFVLGAEANQDPEEEDEED